MLRKLYNQASNFYADPVGIFWKKQMEKLKESIKEILLFSKINEVHGDVFQIDLGCGTGSVPEVIQELSHLSLKVIGVDISERMIDTCARKLRAKNIEFYPIVGDITHLETWRRIYEKVNCAKVNIITSFYVLHWIKENEIKKIIENLKIILSPDARFVGAFMGDKELVEIWGDFKDYLAIYYTAEKLARIFSVWNPKSVDQMENILVESGFSKVQLASTYFKESVRKKELKQILKYQYRFWSAGISPSQLDVVLDDFLSIYQGKIELSRHFVAFAATL